MLLYVNMKLRLCSSYCQILVKGFATLQNINSEPQFATHLNAFSTKFPLRFRISFCWKTFLMLILLLFE